MQYLLKLSNLWSNNESKSPEEENKYLAWSYCLAYLFFSILNLFIFVLRVFSRIFPLLDFYWFLSFSIDKCIIHIFHNRLICYCLPFMTLRNAPIITDFRISMWNSEYHALQIPREHFYNMKARICPLPVNWIKAQPKLNRNTARTRSKKIGNKIYIGWH